MPAVGEPIYMTCPAMRPGLCEAWGILMEPIGVYGAHRELVRAQSDFRAGRHKIAASRLVELRARAQASLEAGHMRDRILGNSTFSRARYSTLSVAQKRQCRPTGPRSKYLA